jgi:hypothetical protein
MLFNVPGPAPDVGAYRVVPPSRFESGVLASAAQLGSSVWAGGITRFRGAVPVAAVYDKGGQPADTEPTGLLGGYLQCESAEDYCAWADYSGIVVVSQSPPAELGALVQITVGSGSGQADAFYSEQALAGLTMAFRDLAELRRHA